jgi:hypothetical protein
MLIRHFASVLDNEKACAALQTKMGEWAVASHLVENCAFGGTRLAGSTVVKVWAGVRQRSSPAEISVIVSSLEPQPS